MNTPSTIKIKITNAADGYGVKISTPDRDAFAFAIDELKNVVPSNCRTYDPTKKFWTITDSSSLDDWLYELRRVYDVSADYNGEQPNNPPPRPPQSLATPYKTLHLLPDAPPEVVKAAYKALARIYHPDLRGDTAKMVEINRAYETLTQGR
jgi:hypothetical protein